MTEWFVVLQRKSDSTEVTFRHLSETAMEAQRASHDTYPKEEYKVVRIKRGA